MIHLEKPKKFNPAFEIVSCFLEKDGKFLLLHREDTKPQGNTWGVPAGKVEKNETAIDAMRRELEEETGIKTSKDSLKIIRTVFVGYPEYDFVYHMYQEQILKNHPIVIDPKSHKDFRWVTPREALKMTLIPDLDACIKIHYKA